MAKWADKNKYNYYQLSSAAKQNGKNWAYISGKLDIDGAGYTIEFNDDDINVMPSAFTSKTWTHTQDGYVVMYPHPETPTSWWKPDTEWLDEAVTTMMSSFQEAAQVADYFPLGGVSDFFDEATLYQHDENIDLYQHVTTLYHHNPITPEVQEEYALYKLFPCLQKITYTDECPVGGCNFLHSQIHLADGDPASLLYRLCLASWIVHLNDTHKWPRTEHDFRKFDNGTLEVPTILGWLSEQAEKNGWDLTCTLPQ